MPATPVVLKHQFRVGDKVRAIGTTEPLMRVLAVEKTIVTVSGAVKHPPYVLRVAVDKIELAPTEIWMARTIGDL